MYDCICKDKTLPGHQVSCMWHHDKVFFIKVCALALVVVPVMFVWEHIEFWLRKQRNKRSKPK